MKKTILATMLLLACILAGGQDNKTYNREGKTFVQKSEGATPFKGDIVTAYTWRDKDGAEYPIVLHTYTKGEKAGRTTAYIVRISKKTGKEYKYYIPNGEDIAKEVINESR